MDDSTEKYFLGYLQENALAAQTIHQMRGNIGAFRDLFVEVLFRRCMDGRNQSTRGDGIPPTAATLASSHGNIVNLSPTNGAFWNALDALRIRAKSRTIQAPALFITEAHKSTRCHGCAAHHQHADTAPETDARAFACVQAQAEGVRREFTTNEVYPVASLTDTDDMSKTLVFPGGEQLSTHTLMQQLRLRRPADIFQPEFLTRRVDNPRTDAEVGSRTPGQMLEGDEPAMYNNLRTAIAMEEYLLAEVSAVESAGRQRNHVFNPALIDALEDALDEVKDMPKELRRIFMHMMIWNCAYASYQDNRIDTLDEAKRQRHLDHAESVVAYGNRNGFATLRRNTALVVTPGSGDDATPLGVGLKVWKSIKSNDASKPLGHINVEGDDPINSWEALAQVLAKLQTRVRTMAHVFGEGGRFLTTYSYGGTGNGHPSKQFYPVHPGSGNGQISQIANVADGLGPQNFSASALREREEQFAREIRTANG